MAGLLFAVPLQLFLLQVVPIGPRWPVLAVVLVAVTLWAVGAAAPPGQRATART